MDSLFSMAGSNLFLVCTLTAVVSVLIGGYYFNSSSKTSERKLLKKDEFTEFPLISKKVLSHNSAIYRFGLPRPTDVLGLPIGQHISISAVINDKEIVRSYTPTTTDLDGKGFFDLLIKVYEQGNISKFVDNLKLGETIRVRGPKGFFTYTPNMVKQFVMVSGGTGITPMYQIIKAIISNPNDHTKVTLLYGNVSEPDILLKKELDDIESKYPNIKVYHVLNNPPQEWKQGQGYINKEVIQEITPKVDDETQLLICGPPPMVSGVKKAAVELGYKKAKPVSKLGDQIFVF